MSCRRFVKESCFDLNEVIAAVVEVGVVPLTKVAVVVVDVLAGVDTESRRDNRRWVGPCWIRGETAPILSLIAVMPTSDACC